MKKHYVVAKTNYNSEIILVNYEKLDGFKVSPKNGINYPGIKVNTLMIVKPSFIEKVLKRKIQKKLDAYLKYFLELNDEDDDTDFRESLDELERFKGIIDYKYRSYLDDKYINLLLKKISLIEREMKVKIINQNKKREKIYEQMLYGEPTLEETRRRSR